MEFIEAKINPNSTLKMLSKRSRRGPLKVKQRRIKKGEKPNPRHNNLARPCQAMPRGTAKECQVARSCHPARPGRATFLAGWPCWVLGARSVRPVSARVLPRFARVLPCFPPFCSPWCLGLPPSSTLPWTYFWSPLFHWNPRISLEMKTKCNLRTIWIEGS